MQSNSVALDLPVGKPKPARLALNCPSQATKGNPETLEQQPSAILALIDEVFVKLDWKQEHVARLIGKNPGTISKGLREMDRKVFDVRWLDRMPMEFWITFHKLLGLKFGLTLESRAELLLGDAIGILAALQKLLERTAVSE